MSLHAQTVAATGVVSESAAGGILSLARPDGGYY
jgi:hypothetical protein